MAIKNSVSNYFWSMSIVLTYLMLPIWCGFVVCLWTFYLELFVLERKVYNNEDITFLSVY